MDHKIYILHEYSTPSHYYAMAYLAKSHGLEVEYYVIPRLKHLIDFRDMKLLKRNYRNWLFALRMLFSRHKIVVIGIAPFNVKLIPLLIVLKHHFVYYHTSYTCWNGDMQAHGPKNCAYLLKKWRYFTSQFVQHIFAVSEKTKRELIANGFADKERITVVNHSFNIEIPISQNQVNRRRFIFVGRLAAGKGIDELLRIFSQKPECTLTIVGDGILRSHVEEYASKYENIHYLGYISGLKNILPHYFDSDFVVMNSVRNEHWEELFGIALIEGMAAGCVPIATNHSGPREIITEDVNGFICEEGTIADKITIAENLSDADYLKMKEKAVKVGQSYSDKVMSARWLHVLDHLNS